MLLSFAACSGGEEPEAGGEENGDEGKHTVTLITSEGVEVTSENPLKVEDGGRAEFKISHANNDAVQIYERDMMKSEIYWYQVMSRQTDLRIPKVYFTDFSKELVPTNYFIMEYISGTQKDELTLTPAQKQKVMPKSPG